MSREALPSTSFVTFSCHGRNHWLSSPRVRDRIASAFGSATGGGVVELHAWVVMSNHIHVLATDGRSSVAAWLSAFRRDFALADRDAIRGELPAPAQRGQFWLRGGGHHRSIWSWQEYWQKVRYIHANPVRAGLCACPTEWRWSSALEYSGTPRLDMPRISDPPEGLTDLLWRQRTPDPFGVDRRP